MWIGLVCITIDSVNKKATFTAPGAGSALIFQSQVNGGKNPNGTTNPAYTTTFGVYVLTSAGNRVAATNERAEGSAAYGWVTKINALIRSIGLFGTASNAVQSLIEPPITTTNATPVNTASAVYAMPDLTAADVIVRVVAKQAASSNYGAFDLRVRAVRNGGAPSLDAVIAGGNQRALGAAAATIAASGNSLVVTLTGIAATTIVWSVTMEVHPVTTGT